MGMFATLELKSASEAEAEVEEVDAAKDEAAFSERTFQVCSTRGRLTILNCKALPLLIPLHMLG